MDTKQALSILAMVLAIIALIIAAVAIALATTNSVSNLSNVFFVPLSSNASVVIGNTGVNSSIALLSSSSRAFEPPIADTDGGFYYVVTRSAQARNLFIVLTQALVAVPNTTPTAVFTVYKAVIGSEDWLPTALSTSAVISDSQFYQFQNTTDKVNFNAGDRFAVICSAGVVPAQTISCYVGGGLEFYTPFGN
jgi:hypothetical protein